MINDGFISCKSSKESAFTVRWEVRYKKVLMAVFKVHVNGYWWKLAPTSDQKFTEFLQTDGKSLEIDMAQPEDRPVLFMRLAKAYMLQN